MIIAYKNDKKSIIGCILVILIFVLRTIIILIPSKLFEEGFLIVVQKKENYVILFNGIKKFLYYTNDKNIDELDILKYIGANLLEVESNSLESGFNYKEYLANTGVYKQLSFEKIGKIFDFPLDFFSIKQNILKNYQDINVKTLISGLLFGDLTKSDLKAKIDSLDIFILFSLSGVHINYVFYLFKKIFTFKLDERKSEILALIILLPIFIINFTKFSILRVFIYIFLKIFNNLHGKKYSNQELHILLALFFLFIDPFLIKQQKFIIPFFLSIYLNCCRSYTRKFNKIKQKVLNYGVFVLFILPFNVNNNYSINIVNILIISLLFTIIKPLLPIFMLAIFGIKINLVVFLSKIIIFIINSLNFKFFSIPVPKLNTVILVIYFLLLIASLYFLEINFKKVSRKIKSIFLVFSLFYIAPFNNAITCEISFINVGQGDSTLIRTNFNSVLIDTGGSLYSDIANNNLIPYLRSKRIYKLDAVFITHNDIDHNGALNSLKNNFIVYNIYNNDANFPIKIGGMNFDNLNLYGKKYQNDNDKSLVLKVDINSYKLLIMGDASIAIENEIMLHNKNIYCDIFKVGHHGSNSSTSQEFINYLKPKVAIISCGLNNVYHHPHVEVLDILKKYKIPVRRTDLEGTITYKFYG